MIKNGKKLNGSGTKEPQMSQVPSKAVIGLIDTTKKPITSRIPLLTNVSAMLVSRTPKTAIQNSFVYNKQDSTNVFSNKSLHTQKPKSLRTPYKTVPVLSPYPLRSCKQGYYQNKD